MPDQSTDERFLELSNITKQFGENIVVDNMNLSIREGELVAFLGPSGCGKTTTMHMIAGFVNANSGSITVGGERIDHLPSRSRGTSMVFQDYALFPHMTIFDNVAFGLRMRKLPKDEIKAKVEEALRFVRLAAVSSKYPNELSGGMKQRVALARGVVVEPQILLLDEPLSNLDAKLRKDLRVELRELHDRLGITTIFVTHDLEEAFYVADRVAVMYKGRLEQFATPNEIYSSPASPFVADFVGHTNVISGAAVKTHNGDIVFRGENFEAAVPDSSPVGPDGVYTLPPHRIRLSTGSERPKSSNALRATVHMVAYLGAVSSILVDAGNQRLQCDVSETELRSAELDPGTQVWIHWDTEDGAYVRV